MDIVEAIGLVVFASLFVRMGIHHIRNHVAVTAYTKSVLGNGAVSRLGVLGGMATGVFLIVAGIWAAFGEPIALFALAAWLTLAALLFHRNFLQDPSGFKTISLAGAALALGALLS